MVLKNFLLLTVVFGLILLSCSSSPSSHHEDTISNHLLHHHQGHVSQHEDSVVQHHHQHEKRRSEEDDNDALKYDRHNNTICNCPEPSFATRDAEIAGITATVTTVVLVLLFSIYMLQPGKRKADDNDGDDFDDGHHVSYPLDVKRHKPDALNMSGGGYRNLHILSDGDDVKPTKFDQELAIPGNELSSGDLSALGRMHMSQIHFDPWQRDENGLTAMHYALARSDIMMLQRTLTETRSKNGTDLVDQTDDSGNSLIHWAVVLDSSHLVQVLLHYGANVDRSNKNLHRPLHLACIEGVSVTIAKLLIKRDATVDALDEYGNSPFSLACQNGYDHLLSALLEGGANFNIQDVDGKTPLMKAAFMERQEIVRRLLSKRSTRVNMADRQGYTALHWACVGNSIASAQLLLRAKKPTMDKVNNRDETSLHLAVREENTEIVKLLLNTRSDYHTKNLLEKKTVENLSALDYAVRYKSRECYSLIFEKMASLSLLSTASIPPPPPNDNNLPSLPQFELSIKEYHSTTTPTSVSDSKHAFGGAFAPKFKNPLGSTRKISPFVSVMMEDNEASPQPSSEMMMNVDDEDEDDDKTVTVQDQSTTINTDIKSQQFAYHNCQNSNDGDDDVIMRPHSDTTDDHEKYRESSEDVAQMLMETQGSQEGSRGDKDVEDVDGTRKSATLAPPHNFLNKLPAFRTRPLSMPAQQAASSFLQTTAQMQQQSQGLMKLQQSLMQHAFDPVELPDGRLAIPIAPACARKQGSKLSTKMSSSQAAPLQHNDYLTIEHNTVLPSTPSTNSSN